ncbi:MAG TPA: hypothetical protein HA367_03365 [Candidatus Methanofastidiosum sp.]|nr:hypothetical protein [Methanofastidiosum sp.]
MNQKSYWIRVYEIVFTSLILSSIIYLITSNTKDISNTILGGSILIPLAFYYGIQVDYYLYKIGTLKKLGNILLMGISVSMLFISYGLISELQKYLNNLKELLQNNIETAEVINNYVLNESWWLLGGLLLLNMMFFFAIIYYYPEIKSHFYSKHSKCFLFFLTRSNIITSVFYTIAFISNYLMRIFHIENIFYSFIFSCIILLIIYLASDFFKKREINVSGTMCG